MAGPKYEDIMPLDVNELKQKQAANNVFVTLFVLGLIGVVVIMIYGTAHRQGVTDAYAGSGDEPFPLTPPEGGPPASPEVLQPLHVRPKLLPAAIVPADAFDKPQPHPVPRKEVPVLTPGPIVSIEEDGDDPTPAKPTPWSAPPLPVEFRICGYRGCEYVVMARLKGGPEDSEPIGFVHSEQCRYCALRKAGMPVGYPTITINGKPLPEQPTQVVPEEVVEEEIPEPIPGPEAEDDVKSKQNQRDDKK